MDLSALRTFVDVARLGSFAAAARSRNADPSAVSRTIASLETELGVRLLHRTTRRMSLTEAGETYLSRIEGAVDELADAGDAARAASDGPSGTLRLTASVAFGHARLVPLLERFRQSFPAMRLELVLSDANLNLIAERIDLAVRLGPEIESGVRHERLMSTHYRVCASAEYVERHGPPTEPAALAQIEVLRLTLPGYRDRWSFRDRAGGLAEVPVHGSLLISNAMALRDAMLAGLGPALLPDWLVDEALAQRRCVDLFPGHAVTATTFETAAWLVYPSRRFLPTRVRAVMAFLREQLAAGGSAP